MTDAPIFIFSSGRCGSTLMQRILNSYPDITIWGEHNGFLRGVAEGFFTLVDPPGANKPRVVERATEHLNSIEELAQLKAPEQWQGLMNNFSEDQINDHFRALLRDMFTNPVMPAGHLWGFKEIRYGRDDRVIEFLHRLYPGAHFVFLVRNGLNTVASKSGRFYTARHSRSSLTTTRKVARAARSWHRQYQEFRQWHQSGRLHSHWIAFEDLAENIDTLTPLLAALGKTADEEQQRVLAMKEGRGTGDLDGNLDQRYRQLTYPQQILVQWFLDNLNTELGYTTPASLQWVSAARRKFNCLGRFIQGRAPS